MIIVIRFSCFEDDDDDDDNDDHDLLVTCKVDAKDVDNLLFFSNKYT